MTSSEIIKKIEDEHIKILSQIEVSDNEYEELKIYVKRMASLSYMSINPSPDIKTALALVEIAIRCYEEGNYWDKFFEEIGLEKTSLRQTYLGSIFLKTIHKYDLFEIDKVNGRNAYVENIKAHAFVTNAYMDDFFNFAYSFYENNLCRQIDGYKTGDIKDLSIFMNSILGEGDTFKQERGMVSKSYRLTKSTKEVFAGMDVNNLYIIFYPILKMIDDWFFGSSISGKYNNRYGKLFKVWSAKWEAEENSSKHRNAIRNTNGRRPYLKIDFQNERVYLIIPQQKFKNDFCNGYADANISINGKTDIKSLELYSSYGNFISEEEKIKINMSDIFDEVSVYITGMEKTYKIPAKNYRFFDENFCSINRVKKGRYYLITTENTKVAWQNFKDKNELPSPVVYNGQKHYNVEFDEFIQCIIDGEKFSVSEKVKLEPFYENIIDNFEVYYKEEKITATRNHPQIKFIIEKENLLGTKLLIEEFCGILGNERIVRKYEKNIRDIKEKIEFEECILDDSKYIVTLELKEILESKRDDIYSIDLDIPGEKNKGICEYCLLSAFDYSLKNQDDFPLFTYGDIAELQLFTDNCSVKICNTAVSEAKPSNGYDLKYTFLVQQDIEDIKIHLNALDAIIKIPINILAYNFSSPDDLFPKKEYIWHSDVSDVLFVKILDCDSVSAYFGKSVNECCRGEKVKGHDDLYRIDIEEIHNKIKSCTDVFCYINLAVKHKKYGTIPVSLPKILRKLYVTPYFDLKFNGNVPYVDVQIKGDAELHITVKDEDFGTVIEDKKITEGINELPELKPECKYTFYPFMIEEGIFFDDVRTELKMAKNRWYINPNILLNRTITIDSVIYRGKKLKLNESYFIIIYKKSKYSKTYLGKLYAEIYSPRTIKTFPRTIRTFIGKVKIVLRTNNELYSIKLEEWSNDEKKWLFLYYDLNQKRILSCDDKKITSTANNFYTYDKSVPINSMSDIYNRFLELDDDNTIFESYIKFIKKKKKTTYKIGHIVEMISLHTCGTNCWEILRIGADFKIKCRKCGEWVMLSRNEFEAEVKSIAKDQNK